MLFNSEFFAIDKKNLWYNLLITREEKTSRFRPWLRHLPFFFYFISEIWHKIDIFYEFIKKLRVFRSIRYKKSSELIFLFQIIDQTMKVTISRDNNCLKSKSQPWSLILRLRFWLSIKTYTLGSDDFIQTIYKIGLKMSVDYMLQKLYFRLVERVEGNECTNKKINKKMKK